MEIAGSWSFIVIGFAQSFLEMDMCRIYLAAICIGLAPGYAMSAPITLNMESGGFDGPGKIYTEGGFTVTTTDGTFNSGFGGVYGAFSNPGVLTLSHGGDAFDVSSITIGILQDIDQDDVAILTVPQGGGFGAPIVFGRSRRSMETRGRFWF